VYAASLARNAITALYTIIKGGGSVLFVGDLSTSSGLQLFRLNYLVSNEVIVLANLQYGDIRYHYHRWGNSIFLNDTCPHFDLVVVCAVQPGSIQGAMFERLATFSLIVGGVQERPGLFDYCVPPTPHCALAVQLIVDIAAAAYLSRNYQLKA
jgi:hypothetical protein